MQSVFKLKILLPLLLGFGCSQPIEVNYDFDDGADFAAIKTYDFDLQSSGTTGGGRISAYQDVDVQKGVLWAVNRGLNDEGMQQRPVNPDIIVIYQIKPIVTDENRMLSSDTGVVESASLSLDFRDGETHESVWKGTAVFGINVEMTQTDFNKLMYKAVVKLLEDYPPRKS